MHVGNQFSATYRLLHSDTRWVVGPPTLDVLASFLGGFLGSNACRLGVDRHLAAFPDFVDKAGPVLSVP